MTVFCNGTYAANMCMHLPLAASWAHQNAPNSFCAVALARWELATLLRPLMGWGGDISSPQRLQRLGLGASAFRLSTIYLFLPA